jgi:hypothetical protein
MRIKLVFKKKISKWKTEKRISNFYIHAKWSKDKGAMCECEWKKKLLFNSRNGFNGSRK